MSEFFKKISNALAWERYKKAPVVKNKVVISNYYGAGFGDNLRPIAEKLLEKGGWEIVWLCASDKARASLPDGIRAADYEKERIKEISTAGVWIDNCRKGARYKKPGQIYIQTWHGFALKRIEKDVVETLGPGYEEYATRDSAQTDLIVSDSAFMSEIYRTKFWYSGEIEEFGSPRNDALANHDEKAYKKVRDAFGLPENKKIVLYAPTFRHNKSLEPYSIDYARLRKALEERFGGEFAVIIRLHPAVMKLAGNLNFDDVTTFNGSTYQDMQELLCAADLCITDYSSLMFDYMLTRRPCLQYATDIEDYMSDRNFNFSLEKCPFPLARSNDELEKAIADFNDEDYQKALDKFMDEFGIVADGKSAERVVNWLEEKI